MQALIPILGSFGSALTAPAVVATAGATAGSLASASAGLGVISSVFGTVSALRQLSYQRQVAANAVKVAGQNAKMRTFTAAQEAQDQDAQAAAALGDLTARQAESGFAVSSPSFQRVIARNRIQSQVNSQRLIEAGAIDAENYRREAKSVVNETKQNSPFTTLLSGALDVGTSMISGATLVKKAKVNALQRSF